jgi:hypothetical protein
VTEYVSPAERERVVQQLAEHFTRDQLSLDEYERRVTEAYRARGMEALAALTRDLVPAAVPAVSTAAVPGPRPAAGVKRILALMSGVVRRGNWTVPPRLRAAAVMGGIELDLREATLSAPVTDIYVIAVMGAAVITAPPHVRVEADGLAILGGFEDQLQLAGSSDPSAPLIRVRGVAIMGGVEVKVKSAEPEAAEGHRPE